MSKITKEQVIEFLSNLEYEELKNFFLGLPQGNPEYESKLGDCVRAIAIDIYAGYQLDTLHKHLTERTAEVAALKAKYEPEDPDAITYRGYYDYPDTSQERPERFKRTEI